MWNPSDYGGETLYCTRYRVTGIKKCDSGYVRYSPSLGKNYEKWRISEVLMQAGFWNSSIIANLDGSYSNVFSFRPETCIAKICGTYNWLNNIKDRLRCSKCGKFMQFNFKYAKNFFAAYSVTVASCPDACGDGKHDEDIYLNHCNGCGDIIDSRESCHQAPDKYYVCIHCGSHRDGGGDICPNCGETIPITGYDGLKRTCPYCDYKFEIPRKWSKSKG